MYFEIILIFLVINQIIKGIRNNVIMFLKERVYNNNDVNVHVMDLHCLIKLNIDCEQSVFVRKNPTSDKKSRKYANEGKE